MKALSMLGNCIFINAELANGVSTTVTMEFIRSSVYTHCMSGLVVYLLPLTVAITVAIYELRT